MNNCFVFNIEFIFRYILDGDREELRAIKKELDELKYVEAYKIDKKFEKEFQISGIYKFLIEFVI